MNDDLNSRLARNRYIAILRGVAPDEVDGIATALLDEGIDIIEVPLNSPQPLESIRRLAKHCPTATWIGAGTVLDSASVRAVALAGARFVVAPNADSGVVSAAKRNGLVAIPGVFTPSEALRMLAAGADALKLFPAEAASPAVLKAMLAVFPAGTCVLPVGGIRPEHVAGWRAAGAAGFGIGSALYAPGLGPDEVRARARAFAAVRV